MKQAISTIGPPRPDGWAAWQHELSSQRDAELAANLRQREPALYPRFNDYYRRLHALPRRWRRGIGRRLRQSLAGVALLLALGHGAAFAAIINVDGTVCTLIDAITAANTDTATGGCPAGSGADTLVLPVGSTTTLTAVDNNNDTWGPNGLPVISSEITMEGNGSTVERSAAPGTPEFRILRVDGAGDLTLTEVTISGGKSRSDRSGGGIRSDAKGDAKLTIIDSTVSGNWAARGGGISSGGDLTIIGSTISGNTARWGGGGIYSSIPFSDGKLSITDSTISGNSAGRGGGGVVSNWVYSTFINSTISGNSAGVDGGGIVSNGDHVSITNSTISGNSAGRYGGGISGEGTITNTTVSGNVALSGGGIATYGNPYDDLKFVVQESTVSGNVATQSGGGLLARYSYYRCRGDEPWHCTGGIPDGYDSLYFADSTMLVSRSIVSGNTSPEGAEIATISNPDGYASGTVVSNGYGLFAESDKSNANAFSENSLGDIAIDPTDITATSDGTNPTAPEDILDPVLGFNGGPTQTHALVQSSPALDAAGVDCPPPTTDQRGIARPLAAACDIGAFEGWVGNVNDLVTFDPDPSSYQSTRDATGCPTGYRGKYMFTATLGNVSGLELNGLSAKIDTLTGGNLVLAPNGALLGAGAKLRVPAAGDYADGILSPGETAETPFDICLKKWRGFEFFVDAYGSPMTD